ncbi:MAG: primosomal replication protein N [Nitrosomonadales bacterium]|nr:primosomal replication protein N [Nitrosomonadales bacterium]
MNKLQIEGEILFEDKIRYTPSGLVVQSFKIGHKSFQKEANLKKDVSIELEAIFIDKHMRKEIQIGKQFLFIGFLDKKSFKSTKLVFHISEIKKLGVI